jgi:hypothetical protein
LSRRGTILRAGAGAWPDALIITLAVLTLSVVCSHIAFWCQIGFGLAAARLPLKYISIIAEISLDRRNMFQYLLKYEKA